jgi:hypothetical protein
MIVPIIDQHCHPPYKPLPANAAHVLTTGYSESHDTDMLRQHVPHTLFFCRAVSDLAAWFVSAGRIEATTATTIVAQRLQQNVRQLYRLI